MYGTHVVPDFLVAHVEAVVVIKSDTRARIGDDLFKFIVERLLKCDDHPTLTRFFTFRGCIDAMLTMHLLAMPQAAFVVKGVVPRKDNQKRLKNIQKFFANDDSMQALRRASLVLQLTGGVEAIMASKPKAGEPPPVVRIVGDGINPGEAHQSVSNRFAHILSTMHLDKHLSLGPATGVVFAAAFDILTVSYTHLTLPTICSV